MVVLVSQSYPQTITKMMLFVSWYVLFLWLYWWLFVRSRPGMGGCGRPGALPWRRWRRSTSSPRWVRPRSRKHCSWTGRGGNHWKSFNDNIIIISPAIMVIMTCPGRGTCRSVWPWGNSSWGDFYDIFDFYILKLSIKQRWKDLDIWKLSKWG